MNQEMEEQIESLKNKLCHGGRILSYKGLNESFGHLSARIPGEDKFLITTRGALAFVKLQQIEVVDFSGQKLTKNSPEGAPNELFLHAEVYKARFDVAAIARTQSPWCEIFGIRLEPVKIVHDFGATLLGETSVLDQPLLGDVENVGKTMIAALGVKNAILLRGNGNVVVGKSIEEAVVRAVFLDESARLQYQARLLGQQEVKYFTEDEIEVHGKALSRVDRTQRAWDNWLELALLQYNL